MSGHPAVRAGRAVYALDLVRISRSLARKRPAGLPDQRQPHLPAGIAGVDIHQRHGLPGAEREGAGYHGSRMNGGHDRGQDVRAPVPARAVRVPPSARRQAAGRRAPQSGRRRHRPRAPSPRHRPSRAGRTHAAARRPRRSLASELGALRGDVVHRLAAACPHVDCHGFSCRTAHTVPVGFRTRDAAQENARDPMLAATVTA